MGLDCPVADNQFVGYFTVRFPLCDERCHLAFTLREPAKGFFGNTAHRDRFFSGKRGERGMQEVFTQVDIINCSCQRCESLSRRGKVALGQVFLLEVLVLPSQRTMELPEEWQLLASQGTLRGFLYSAMARSYCSTAFTVSP